MKRSLVAASAALILGPLSAAVYGITPSVAVEQIEVYENNSDGSTSTRYAPVIFGNGSSVELYPGQLGGYFPYITFTAVGSSNTASSESGHAYTVGRDFYGNETVAYPDVTNVYCDAYDDFMNNTVGTQAAPGVGPAPGDFSSGVEVVNTSYVLTYQPTYPDADTDALRRIDTMICNDKVTFVAGAVTSTGDGNFYDLNWSCYNSLAVSGQQSFSPSGGPGKQHADLYLNEDASFGAATVSGYSAALYGTAQKDSQTDAMQNVVNRSLLLAGAQNNVRSGQPITANHLDPIFGAGNPDYGTSLQILNSGEQALLNVSAGSVSGAPSPSQQGWTYGTVASLGKDALLFTAANTITGLTASLNWNVMSPIAGGNINTSTSALNFPKLTLQVVPVTATGGGNYSVGANQSNSALFSISTIDNIQYLNDTASLPAGTYAFLIGGDSSLSATVGFSYALAGSFASQWNNSAGSSWGTATNWTSGIPNGRGAQARLLSSPGLTSPSTITLDNYRTVGQLFFNNANGYTIASGSQGTLGIDDTGDSSGTANPQINVSSGSQVISAPISIVNGVNITVASGASLSIAGSLSSSSPLTKFGSGTLTFSSAISSSAFNLTGGTTTVTTAGSLNAGPVSVNTGATLNFAASASTGIFARSIGVALNLNGGTLLVSPAALTTNRQVVQLSSPLTITESAGSWQGTVDLANNDLDDPGDSLSTVTSEILEGYNNGQWNGPGGILSSSAASDSTHLTALGVIQNNQSGTALYTASNPFDGITPGTSDILVKFTYFGDTNLDGKVDGTDYSRIDNGFADGLTGWFNGDFNYDGVVNGSDYTLIDNAFNSQGAQISSELAGPDAIATSTIASTLPGSSVPEPGGLSILGITTMALLGRRIRLCPARQR